jgi:hypothetical protein
LKTSQALIGGALFVAVLWAATNFTKTAQALGVLNG